MIRKALLSSLALLAAHPVADASPVASPGNIIASAVNAAQCLLVDVVVNALHAYPSATPFCSSYLGIQTSTISTTTTTTLPVVTATFVTTASTSTVILPASTTTTTVVNTLSTCIPAGGTAKAKRKVVATTSTPLPAPTLPSFVAQFSSAAISTACSCLAIPTPSTTTTIVIKSSPTVTATVSTYAATTPPASTVTVTATSTSTVPYCPTPTSCNNLGIQYGAFNNPENNNNDGSYSTFDSTFMKSTAVGGQGTANLIYSSVTTTAGGINNHCDGYTISVYGSSTTIPCKYFALDHRGYIFAEKTGTYTFFVYNIDDIFLLWTGPTAQAGWDNTNTALTVNENASNGTLSVALTQGEYLPIRFVFGQAQGYAIFGMSVTGPDETVILDSATSGSPYVVQYSCDGTSAPQFAGAFGQEV